MAQHPSLRSKQKGKQHRSVLKRYERVKELKEKEKWQEGDSVFGLPKLKILRFKIKKEKAAPAPGAAQEAQAAGLAEETQAQGTGREGKAPAKGAAPKAAPPEKKPEKKGEKK